MMVQFKHFRNYQWDYNLNALAPHPRGGVTIAYVEGDETSEVGIAICSAADGFSKQVGRDTATKRLLTNPAIISSDALESILYTNSDINDLHYDSNLWRILDHFDLEQRLIDKASTYGA